ncbi:uncharacterized protein [Macrobrachium rosenbergii]|uniref:uncharacterized protein n=1 Tax=Macrobrachium rosenbergii TaxID=79674 RepID=UPI0034D5FD18
MHYFDDFETEAAVQFLADPQWEENLFELNKEQLFILADHLELDVSADIRKGQLIHQVLKAVHSAKGAVPKKSNYDVDSDEVSELRLQILREQTRLRELDLEKAKLESHEREKEREHELEVLRLRLECGEPSRVENKFNLIGALKLVPHFDESNVSEFFCAFEKVARKLEWPKDMWTTLVQCRFKGKAQRVYTNLKEDLSFDYDSVKAIVLKAYDLVPEAYRQKFRNLKKTSEITFVEFARRKEQYFDDWLKSKEVYEMDRLRELILVEEFKDCVSRELKTHLEELKLDSLQEVAIASDEYVLTHKQVNKSISGARDANGQWYSSGRSHQYVNRNNNSRSNKECSSKDVHNNNSSSDNCRAGSSNVDNGGGNFRNKVYDRSPRRGSGVNCFWCNKKGHIKSECFARKRYLESKIREPVTVVSAETEVPPQ